MTWELMAPGTWLIFGIILLPVYTVLLAWFLGSPRNVKTALMGVAYLFIMIAALWIGLFIKTVSIDLVFF